MGKMVKILGTPLQPSDYVRGRGEIVERSDGFVTVNLLEDRELGGCPVIDTFPEDRVVEE